MSSPGFSRVRVLYGSESGSESESGPGFAVCHSRRLKLLVDKMTGRGNINKLLCCAAYLK